MQSTVNFTEGGAVAILSSEIFISVCSYTCPSFLLFLGFMLLFSCCFQTFGNYLVYAAALLEFFSVNSHIFFGGGMVLQKILASERSSHHCHSQSVM